MPQTTLKVEILPHCPLCQAVETEPIMIRPDPTIPALQLLRCPNCEIIFLSPRLTLDSMITMEEESEVYNYSPEQIEGAIHYATTVLARLLPHLPPQTEGNKRLLDIGCNRGFLMEVARRAGWQVTGVEISTESAQQARNDYQLAVYATVDEVPPTQTFDLITAWHVLEHTFDPIGFLSQAAERLAPHGVLAVQVPSFDFVDEFHARDQMGSIINVVHNFHFTEKTMPKVIERAGLQLLHIDNDPDELLLTAICARPTGAAAPHPLRRLAQTLARWRR